jgi:hypothetical protein
MHKNVNNKSFRASLFLSMGVALATLTFAQASARAESGHDGYLSHASDDYRHQEQGRYDYHDGRTAHEGHEYKDREYRYSQEEAERAQRERAHHEHEEREQRSHN